MGLCGGVGGFAHMGFGEGKKGGVVMLFIVFLKKQNKINLAPKKTPFIEISSFAPS